MTHAFPTRLSSYLVYMLFMVDPAQNTCCPCGMVNIVAVEAGIAGIIVETGIKIRFFQCKAFTGAAFQFLQPAEFLQEGSGQYLLVPFIASEQFFQFSNHGIKNYRDLSQEQFSVGFRKISGTEMLACELS